MTIFAVLLPSPQPAVVAEIVAKYQHEHIQLSETQYLLSSRATAVDISNNIGLTGAETNFTPKGVGVVIAMSSYFGRAPTTVWDWIKVKLEAQPSA